MRTRAAAAVLAILSLLSAPAGLAQNSCAKYQCEQAVTQDRVSERYCAQTFGGRWIECRVIRYCTQVVGNDGTMTRQCTAYNCEGETCFWV